MDSTSILSYETQLEEHIRLGHDLMTIEERASSGVQSYVRFCPICGKRQECLVPVEQPCSEQCVRILDQDISDWLDVQFEEALPRALQILEETPVEEWVYFIRATESGKIKIGYSRDVPSRLASLQTTCPEPLELLCMVKGDRYLEAKLHQQFADFRGLGEWFEPVPEVLNLIGELRPAKTDESVSG